MLSKKLLVSIPCPDDGLPPPLLLHLLGKVLRHLLLQVSLHPLLLAKVSCYPLLLMVSCHPLLLMVSCHPSWRRCPTTPSSSCPILPWKVPLRQQSPAPQLHTCGVGGVANADPATILMGKVGIIRKILSSLNKYFSLMQDT